MFCHKCGSDIPKSAGFCHKCGAKLVVEDIASQVTIEPSAANVSNSTQTSLQMPATATSESSKTQENAKNSPVRSTDSTKKLLEEAISEAMTRCITCLIFGVFLALIGLLGIFGIAIFLIEGGDTEALVVSLAMGLLITPIAVISLIAASKYKKTHAEVKKHKREAEKNPHYRLPSAMEDMVKAYEKMGRKSTQEGKRALRELIRMFGA